MFVAVLFPHSTLERRERGKKKIEKNLEMNHTES